MPRAGRLLIVLVLLVSGSAGAESGGGVLDVKESLRIFGDVALHPAGGVLYTDLASTDANPSDAAFTLDLRAAHANVSVVTWRHRVVSGPGGEVPVQVGMEDAYRVEYAEYDDVVISLAPRRSHDARFLLNTTSFHAEATSVTLGDGVLRAITEQHLVLREDVPGHESRSADVPPEAVYAFAVRDAFDVASASGVTLGFVADDAWLYVYGLDLLVSGAKGETTYTSGGSESSTVDDVAVERTRQTTFLVLRMRGIDGVAEVQGATTHWFEASPDVHVLGEVAADVAEGRVTSREGHHAIRGGPVVVGGDLRVTPERTTHGTALGGFRPTVDPEFRAHVSGDVVAVSAPAASSIRPDATAAAVGLVGAVIVLVFWEHVRFWLTVAWLPLYSRLKEPEILGNRARNAIYGIIRDNPGISSRAVHRATDQSWGTVVYHLRQLERHRLVSSKRIGRSRNFYVNHVKYRGMELAIATLKSPRAAAVARAVLAEPSLTQERLVEVTRFAQPTASYYARKLRDAELIAETRDGRRVRYTATRDLERHLGADSAGVDSASGVDPAP